MFNLRIPDFKSGYSPAYLFVILLLSIFVVFLLYGIFHDFIVSMFFRMAIDNGANPDTYNFIVDSWSIYFIIAFIISMIVWVVVNAQRREE